MKVVTVPAPVEIEVPRRGDDGRLAYEKETTTIVKFLEQCFNMYEPFSKGHVNARLYMKLIRVIKGAEDKPEIWFEDDDFKKVLDSTKDASWVTTKINAAYLPFYDAVAGARTEATATEKKLSPSEEERDPRTMKSPNPATL